MSQITSARLPLDPGQVAILNNLINLADSGTCEFITKSGGVFVNTPIGACGGGGSPINGVEAIGVGDFGLGGLLTQNTTIDGDATYTLNISDIVSGGITTTGGSSVLVDATSAILAASAGVITVNGTGVLIETPAVTGLTASVNQVLTLVNATTGEVEYATVQADDVAYDNATSGLAATDVQGAIDEIDGIVSGLPTVVVSADVGNDITTGTDGGAFFQETPETITTITNTVSGHKIADYTNEAAVVVQINETVTSLGFAGTDLTYNNENGTPTVLDLSSLTGKFLSSGSLISGNNTLRLVMSDATNVDVDVTALNVNTTYTAAEGVSLGGTIFKLGHDSIASALSNKLTSHRFINMNFFNISPASVGYGFVMQGFSPAHTPGQQSIVLGGSGNTAQGTGGAVIGSSNSDAGSGGVYSSTSSSVSSGKGAIIGASGGIIDTSSSSVMAGGLNNSMTSTITGGRNFMGGGEDNTILNTSSGSMNAIIAGRNNLIETSLGFNTIIGGQNNSIIGAVKDAFIGGGQDCTASSNGAAFGIGNHAESSSMTVGTYGLEAPASNTWGFERFKVGVGTSSVARADGFVVNDQGEIFMPEIPIYANNAAAISGGLSTHGIYKTATGELRIVV